MLAIFALVLSVIVSYQQVIDDINRGNHGWKATFNPGFSDLSLEEKKALLGELPSSILDWEFDSAEPSYHVESGIPTDFDSREVWPGLISPIRDQGACGGCWAVSAADVFADRRAIKTGELIRMSPQNLIDCVLQSHGCQGGFTSYAMQYIQYVGIASEECDPYTSGSTETRGTCSKECTDGQSAELYRATRYRRIPPDAESIKEEIFYNGPIVLSFVVYEDFYHYESGVYRHVTGKEVGGHAIRAVGYGVSEDGIPYWLIANSWGEDWGEDGYFRILRGSDECDIESRGPYAIYA